MLEVSQVRSFYCAVTDQEKRALIAKACGWSVSLDPYAPNDQWPYLVIGPKGQRYYVTSDYLLGPDYLESIDAMRDAVCAQSDEFQRQFDLNIRGRVGWSGKQFSYRHNLTAADWADVFIKTMERS